MTPPDVSDAAVEAAAKVLGEIVMANSSGTTEHEDGVTIHMTKTVEELGKEALRAAIAAAVEVMGVAGLIEAARVLERKSVERSKTTSSVYTSHVERLRTALANVTRLRTQESAE